MEELPFNSIEKTPEQLSGTNTILRFVEALGFRYRWATAGLRSIDFEFRPSESSMSIGELIEHLHSMAQYVNYNFGGTSIKDEQPNSIEELRLKTLNIYSEIVNRLEKSTDKDFQAMEKLKLENESSPSFWYMLNGPISDSLTHVGQITSWRRIAGNPQPQGINVFKGTTSF